MATRNTKMSALATYFFNELDYDEPVFVNEISRNLKDIWTYNTLKRFFNDFKDLFNLDIRVRETKKGMMIEKKRTRQELIELELKKLNKRFDELERLIKEKW